MRAYAPKLICSTAVLNFPTFKLVFCTYNKLVSLWCHPIACIATDSFPFTGRDRTSGRKAAEQRSKLGVSRKFGEKWVGGEQEGGGGGEKRNRLPSIPNILPNSVCPRTGIQSNMTSEICLSHIIRHPQHKIKIDMSEEAFRKVSSNFLFRKHKKTFHKTANSSC